MVLKSPDSSARFSKFEKDIIDGRGHHQNHSAVGEDVKEAVRSHIIDFPARESHYSRSKNQYKKYLDSSLTVAKMHRLFLMQHPDLTSLCKYSMYSDIFNYEFNIVFGCPRSDICDLCEMHQVAIKAAAANSNLAEKRKLEVEHQLHIRKADVFTVQINEVTEAAQALLPDGDTAVLAMDYQKNLPLPLTGVSQEYYKRQLWIHNLCIHDNVTNDATMFLYAEHYAKKRPNEVISCLNYYFDGLPPTICKVHIFLDNCFSQNKNRYLIAYLNVLAQTRFDEIHVYYPLPGHSRMPCDRDFGRIEKKRRKKDRVAQPSEWVNLIRETDRTNPFRVVYVEHPLTDDMLDDSTPIVKAKDYKKAFDQVLRPPSGISGIRGLLFQRGKEPTCRYAMTTDCLTSVTILKRGKKMSSLVSAKANVQAAYCRYLPIKASKLRDVLDLLKHVSLTKNVTFYSHLEGHEDNMAQVDEELE